MSALSDLLAMNDALNEKPIFSVEEPDGIKNLSEISRQVQMLSMMRLSAPKVLIFAVPNAGKRNPANARKEGIMAGIFDLCAQWEDGEAWAEMKGYDKNGRAGKLSQSQIDWGNRMSRMGKNVACFFRPESAVNWLRDCGAPIAQIR